MKRSGWCVPPQQAQGIHQPWHLYTHTDTPTQFISFTFPSSSCTAAFASAAGFQFNAVNEGTTAAIQRMIRTLSSSLQKLSLLTSILTRGRQNRALQRVLCSAQMIVKVEPNTEQAGCFDVNVAYLHSHSMQHGCSVGIHSLSKSVASTSE